MSTPVPQELQQELQTQNLTMATSGDPASLFAARVAAGLVGNGFSVSRAAAPEPSTHNAFNLAGAGVQAYGAQLVAIGAEPAPAAPAQSAPAVSPTQPAL